MRAGSREVIRGVLLDLDGTIYRGAQEVPGAAQFVWQLRTWNIRHLFVTNRASRPAEDVRDHLRGYGIDCSTEDVLTSAQATVAYLAKGSAYYIGEEGMRRALVEAGFEITDHAPDYVIVSLDRGFTYEKLATASRLIAAGARFVATNPDRALNDGKHVVPGNGALIAAVVAATGMNPLMIGKPEKLILEMALKRLKIAAADAIAVGDNPETDIPAGANAGVRTAYILTGVGCREDAARLGVSPTWIVESFDELLHIVARENNI